MVECYPKRLEVLADNHILFKIIAKAGLLKGWWSGERAWKRSFGRFDPGGKAIATLLFETLSGPQEICHIEAFDDKPPIDDAVQVCIDDDRAGYLRMTRFPADPTLPMLSEVLSRPGSPHVIRYRPQKRCTIRFQSLLNDQPGFVKVFANNEGERIYKDSLSLWEAGEKGILKFYVARPLRWDPLTRSMWQATITGSSIEQQLYFGDRAGLAEKMGRALASLTCSGLTPSMSFGGEDQMKRSRRYASQLSKRIPSLATKVESLLEKVAKIHREFRNRPLYPIHGAPHVHQWLVDGENLGLVDFDRYSLGEPEVDVATFISEVDFENPKKMPVQEINVSFQNGYESIAGTLEPKLLKAYRAHKRLAKALKAAKAIRVDSDLRAKRILQRSLDCLG